MRLGKRPDRPWLRISSGWPRAPCGFSELCSSHCTCVGTSAAVREPSMLPQKSRQELQRHECIGKRLKLQDYPPEQEGEKYYAATECVLRNLSEEGPRTLTRVSEKEKRGARLCQLCQGSMPKAGRQPHPHLPALGQPQRHANQVWLLQSTQKFEKYRFTHLELSVCRNLKPSFNHRVNPSLPHFQVGRARWVAS